MRFRRGLASSLHVCTIEHRRVAFCLDAARHARRYKRAKGAKAIIWKMLLVAEKLWRKLNASELLPMGGSGVTFKDGVMAVSGHLDVAVNHQPERTAA